MFMNNNDNFKEKDYHISLFKPTTKLAKFNKNLIIGLFSVWAIAIFGFQIVLRVIEEPTPEAAFLNYEEVWGQVKNNEASVQEKQVFVQSVLSVLGKVTVATSDRVFLSSAVNNITMQLVPQNEEQVFLSKIKAFREVNYGEENYQSLKKDLGYTAAKYIGVPDYSLEAKLIPLELKAAESSQLNIKKIEMIMPKYLIHNQSVLTDTIFLGFPFHYFYTAVFLLILFVGLCLFYCIATDRKMLELGIED